MRHVYTDRRSFLKAVALASAGAAAERGFGAEPPARPLPPGGIELPILKDVRWDKAPCRFCGTGCHLLVGVKDDRVVAIRGDTEAEVNRGLLCVKGYHAGLILYGKDRLTMPLLRRDGELRPIPWPVAINMIAARIQAHPKKFAMYGSGQWTIAEGYVANKFMKGGLGNNHIEPNARLCMASAVTGYVSTYGVDEPYNCYDDLDHADVVILWGNNFAEMHPILFSRFVDRRLRGEKVVLVDLTTRRTRTSQLADHVMVFQPHSDLAIANGIAHQILASGIHQTDAELAGFLQNYCNFRADADPALAKADLSWDDYKKFGTLMGKPITLEQYAEYVKPYTPEYVAKISGLSVEQIRFLGNLFINRKLKITSLWCMGMNQHTMGTAINNLVHGIHLLSGHWGHPGDGPQSLTGQPSACGTVREVGTLSHALPGDLRVDNPEHREKAEKLWNLPAGRIHPKVGYHTVQMWEKFCSPAEDPEGIDTLWVQVTNPGQTLPNTQQLFDAKAKAKDKFLIVSDVYPTATTELADLVLPSAMWVEKNGVYGNSERRTQQWFRMVPPPGQARDDAWQTIAVAQRLFDMGMPEMKDKDGKFLFHFLGKDGKEFPIADWTRWYEKDGFNVDRAIYEEYRQFTRIKQKDVAPYDELVTHRGMRWPVVQQTDKTWKETRYRFIEGEDPYVAKGKKFQFYHSVTKDDKALIWYRPYVAPPEVPDEQFPFWLDTGRVLEHWHTGTMTMRVPQLQRAMPGAYVEISRDDAQRLGIRTGDLVELETRRGKLILPAWIDGRGSCPKGHVFVPFFDEKRLINRLTLEAHCPYSKQPDYKKCAVKLTRVKT